MNSLVICYRFLVIWSDLDRVIGMRRSAKQTLSATALFTLLIAAVLPVHAQEFECLLEPHEVVNVSSPVAGLLDSVYVERGDQVDKGQIIAKLKSDVERAAVDLSRARAEFGQRKVVRNKELIKQELISSSEKDELETESRTAQLELRQAEAVLNQRTIKSPIDGVVVERFLSAGEFVQSDPILKIAQLNPLNVEVIVPVNRFGGIHKGMKAKVRPEALVNGDFKAKVVIVDRVIDAASGTIGVRLELPNPHYRIPAGLKCRVTFPD
jgi:membrane fusion protein (multidrug efflux system)